MRPELSIPLGALIACVVTYAVTPLAIRVARRTGFMDKPAGYKGHGNPTPYLGGSAIMVGLLVAGLCYEGAAARVGVLGACAFALWIVGTADDRLNISPLLRLGLEIALAGVLYATGNGWSALDIGPLDLLLTIVWVVGIVNAVNLMDNMDGAAATVVGISATGTGALAIVANDPTLAALCMGLAGACAGFLPRNLARPSRIFMGDGGSMPLGLLIAGASMKVASAGGLGAAGVLEASLILGLVILDTSLVVVSRRSGGRPLMTGGRDHLTHRLRNRLKTPRAVAGSLALGQLLLCAATLGVAQAGTAAMVAFAGIVLVAGLWVIGRLEGERWFDAPAAGLLVAETHAALPRRTPTRFVRARDPKVAAPASAQHLQ
jgi:UDP-GlcNAc:undecaprenyl-phosphate/decaprenyl-phosphate GlcNAc-1-phosphate transferase